MIQELRKEFNSILGVLPYEVDNVSEFVYIVPKIIEIKGITTFNCHELVKVTADDYFKIRRFLEDFLKDVPQNKFQDRTLSRKKRRDINLYKDNYTVALSLCKTMIDVVKND